MQQNAVACLAQILRRRLGAGAIENFPQDGSNWRINEPLRRMVTFRQFNMPDSFGWLDDIDSSSGATF